MLYPLPSVYIAVLKLDVWMGCAACVIKGAIFLLNFTVEKMFRAKIARIILL